MNDKTIHSPDLNELLRRREIYLRDGVPPALIANAIADAHRRRARALRAAFIDLGRMVRRLFRRSQDAAALGACDCGETGLRVRT